MTQRTDTEGVTEHYNGWEGITVRLVIHHPTGEGCILAVTGDHPQLGDWREPKLMTLGPERKLLTGGTGRCWELTFPVPGSGIEVEYRYLIMDKRTGTTIWEREPGRRAFFPLPGDVNSDLLEIFDANFVSGMDLDEIPPSLFIGPYPQTLEDIDALKARGVTAVINVQTDDDFQIRRMDWDRFLAYYREIGIDCHRAPIRDFDEEDLTDKLPGAVRLLKRLLDEGKRVYVHCTAGMGRAPAVVIAYLSRYHGVSPEEALEQVRKHRPIVCPNMHAVGRAIRGGI